MGLDFQPDFCGLRPFVPSSGPRMRIVGGKDASKGQFPWQVQIWVQSSPGEPSKCAKMVLSLARLYQLCVLLAFNKKSN